MDANMNYKYKIKLMDGVYIDCVDEVHNRVDIPIMENYPSQHIQNHSRRIIPTATHMKETSVEEWLELLMAPIDPKSPEIISYHN
jgi:hypothetical protein